MGAVCSSSSTGTSSHTQLEPSISTKNSKRKKSSLLSSTNSEGESDDSNEYFEEKNESIAASKSRSPSQHILLTPQVSDTPVCGVREPQMSETKVPTLVDLSPEFQRMMVGRLHGDIPTNCKQIQVFHCAPSDDCNSEIAILFEKVYPELIDYCLEQGCQLEVIDLFEGLADEFGFGHTAHHLASQLLEDAITSNKESIFIVFLNAKCGAIWCPDEIDKGSFESILNEVDDEDKTCLLTWYQLDDSLAKPAYLLLTAEKYSIHTSEKCSQVYNDWKKAAVRLRNILLQTSDPDVQNQFLSGQEKLLADFILCNKLQGENTVWVQRKIKNKPESVDDVNDIDQQRLQNMITRLNDHIDPNKHISLDVDVVGSRVDIIVAEHAKYLQQLSDQCSTVLRDSLDVIVKRIKLQDHCLTKTIHRALTKPLYWELLETSRHCQILCSSHLMKTDIIETMESYVIHGRLNKLETTEQPHIPVLIQDDQEGQNVDVVYPLVVHGPEGCGKSALAAVLANNSSCLDGWSKSFCVVRFIGASIHCRTEEQLVRSLVEQLGLLYEIPLSTIHRKLNRSRPTVFAEFIQKHIPSKNPTIIIIDGLDDLRRTQKNSWLTWLPTAVPSHIRICVFVTTNSAAYKQIRTHLNDATFMTIQPLNATELRHISDSSASKSGRIIEDNYTDWLLKLSPPDVTPLSLKLFGTIWNRHRGTDWTNSFSPITTTYPQIIYVLTYLEGCFGKEIISSLTLGLLLPRHGLSTSEVLAVLLCEPSSLRWPFNKTLLKRVPSVIWYFFIHVLKCLLHCRVVEGVPTYSWKHLVSRELIKSRYSPDIPKVLKELIQYFEGNSLSKNDLINHEINTKDERCKKTLTEEQPLLYGKIPNHRKLQELPWLYCKNGDLELVADRCLFCWEWLELKLVSPGFDEVYDDLMLAIELCYKNTKNDLLLELQWLKKTLEKHRWIIIQDSKQFPLYLCSDMQDIPHSFKRCTMLCKEAQSAVVTHLKIICKPGGGNVLENTQDEEPNLVLTKLFHVLGEPNHVISVAPSTGKVQVWKVATQEAIRTLTGLLEPKDIKLCDSVTAVVLCNRELKVYELDQGLLLSELKGVLNIRMPYYGIHNLEHTIAVARNRMTLNMMNNQTGDMVATFKVGEDRFLNSLLVSANGEICICGDAVQKPFPLLVWDLVKRKLMYDLRIQGHEFLTQLGSISKDGHYVVMACKELKDPDPTFLIVYDLQTGSVFKKWKPEFSVTSVFVSQRATEVISGHEDGSVIVWDLISGRERFTLHGHNRGPDNISLSEDGRRAVTYDSSRRDTTLWMWDLHKGKALGCYCFPYGVSCALMSADGSTVLAGIPGNASVIALCPSGGDPPSDNSLYGDASRRGKVIDLSEAIAKNQAN